jgi:diguanylate cyclase (GGDEF)-like protein/PAS domain S-box-containing protein
MVTNQFYAKLLENLYDGVYFVNKKKVISFWNESAERISGYSKSEMLGNYCSNNTLRHIDDNGTELCIFGCPLSKTLEDGKIREADVYLHHKKGRRVPISIRVSPVRNTDNDIIGAVEVFSDNSQKIELIRKIDNLQKDVFIDPLTQIANRKYGEMHLKTRLNELKCYDVPFGFLIMDIDHFKKVNDTHGHNVGDKVLVMVTQTTYNLLGKMDLIARWGGEEFIVIMPNTNETFLRQKAEKIRMFIEKSWIDIKGENISVTASIGATSGTKNDTVESIVERADKLLYKCKNDGRNCVSYNVTD